MNAAQGNHAKSIITAALELPLPARHEFIARFCPDEHFREEVEALVSHATIDISILDCLDLHSSTERTTRTDESRSDGGELSPGRLVGPYEVVEPLGKGGMGEVYLARDTRLERHVAIKVLSRGGTGSSDQRQVLQEARAVARLNHPRIATVYDVLEADGRACIVMEYVPGQTLADRIRGRRLSTIEILHYAMQILEAMMHAHGLGIIHCDLKPANIRVSADDTLKVLDFGLARQTPATALSGTVGMLPKALLAGHVMGTLAYMAPEQLLGTRVDARADLYSFGVMLYEMAAGERPYAASDPVATLVDMLVRPMAPLPDDIPAPLRRVVTRCLSRSAHDRYASAAECAEALRALTSEPFPAAKVDEPALEPAAEPTKHYVITRDGLRIAYAIHGSGPPLIFVRGWISHLDLMWHDAKFRAFMNRLGRRATVYRYDARGNGLSDRSVKRLDIHSLLLDLEALVDQLDLKQFVLYGSTFGGPIAITYAARHPDRVAKLILEGTYAAGRRITTPVRKLFLLNALRVFPEAAFLLLGYATNPAAEGTSYRRPEMVQQMIAPGTAAKLYALSFAIDVRHEAAIVETPALVLNRLESHSVPCSLGRELAALIPNARFVALPGEAHNAWEGDVDAAIGEIERFLVDGA